MHYLFIKKAFLGLFCLLAVVSLMVSPAGANRVDADGGTAAYLPVVMNGVQPALAATDVVFFGANATWKYFDKGTEPGSGWNLPGFNDGGWAAGSALLGYGNGNERTNVSYGADANNKYVTTYFRKIFTIDNPSAISALKMDLTNDDGAIVYLNGKEVARSTMPAGGVSNTTFGSSCVYVAAPVTLALNPADLVAGNNTLAVEVHQCSANSSDATFGLSLYGATGSVVVVPTATAVAPTAVPPTAVPPTPVPPTAVPPTPVPPTATPVPPPSGGAVFYVTTGGSSSGNGSSSSPWSLAHVLSHPAAVKPGATIYLRGGKYTGNFISRLNGSSTAPITVRAYPGERATLVNSSGSPTLEIDNTSYVNFWGLEITSSYSSRDTSRSASTYGIRVNQGAASRNIKFINVIVHDMQAQGAGWWQALTNAEIYGSLFYFNGTTQLDHGVYAHNVNGTKVFKNNMVFDNASHGFHGYAETAEKGLNNLYLEGNTFFNNGSIGLNTTNGSYGTYKRDILVGGLTTAYGDTITNNYAYYPGSSGSTLNLGYSAGSSGAKVTNNYMAGGSFVVGGSTSGLSMTGNTVYAPGGFSGFSTSSYSNNSWLSSKPGGVKFFVRVNEYENTMANVTIFNWAKQGTVVVPASAMGGLAISAGRTYELHNAQNFYGDVITGVYDGSGITFPMTGRSVAQPMGLSFKPASTFPEFGAFILIVR